MLLRAEVHTPPQLEGDIGQFLAGCVQSLLIGCAASSRLRRWLPTRASSSDELRFPYLPALQLNYLLPKREQFVDEGYQVDVQHDTLIGEQGPLPGYWVKVVGDAASYMTDRNEHFQIPELPSDAKTLAFYQQLCDSCLCYVVVLHPGEG